MSQLLQWLQSCVARPLQHASNSWKSSIGISGDDASIVAQSAKNASNTSAQCCEGHVSGSVQLPCALRRRCPPPGVPSPQQASVTACARPGNSSAPHAAPPCSRREVAGHPYAVTFGASLCTALDGGVAASSSSSSAVTGRWTDGSIFTAKAPSKKRGRLDLLIVYTFGALGCAWCATD